MISLPEKPPLSEQKRDESCERLHGLDHLRAFAIGFVFLFHYYILSGGQPTWLPGVASFGWTGVDLFFVLSGFLISAQLFSTIRQGRRITFAAFFLKRFFRIIPAYLVVVGLYFFVPFFREKEALLSGWKFLTFTQNFGLNLKDYGTFSHAWSLCVEEHFYIALPLVLFILQYTNKVDKAVWLLIVLFVAGFIARIYSFDMLYSSHIGGENSWMYWYQYVYYPTYNRLDGLLIGVSIAGLYTFFPGVWGSISRYGNLLILFGMFLLGCAYFSLKDQQTLYASVLGFPLVSVAYGFIVAGAISPTSYLYKWQSASTAFIATLSYSIYLIHKAVIHMTHKVVAAAHWNDNLVLLACLVTSIGGSMLLNKGVEKPFLGIRTKLMNKR